MFVVLRGGRLWMVDGIFIIVCYLSSKQNGNLVIYIIDNTYCIEYTYVCTVHRSLNQSVEWSVWCECEVQVRLCCIRNVVLSFWLFIKKVKIMINDHLITNHNRYPWYCVRIVSLSVFRRSITNIQNTNFCLLFSQQSNKVWNELLVAVARCLPYPIPCLVSLVCG
jgi:hypothetical protein